MSEPLFSFGIISDCQYADVPDDKPDASGSFDRRYRLSLKKLREAIDFFNGQDLAFTVHLGDLIDQDFASFDRVLPILETSKAPVWQVLGNHDFMSKNREKLGGREKVIKKMGLTTPYYVQQLHGFRFVVLDTNEDGIIAYAPSTSEYENGNKILQGYKDKQRINAQSWNGQISSKQEQWFIDQIKEAEVAGEKVISFSHHGIFPAHRENALNDQEILPKLAAQKSLVAYINGHNHDGDYGRYNHLHCLTIKGMVDTGENTYALAHVYNDRIEIEGFGREQSRTLHF